MTTLTLRDAVEVVLEGYTLHEGARKILETAIAQEQRKTIRNCITCKYSHEPANSAVCTDCKHAYTSADHWEPKP